MDFEEKIGIKEEKRIRGLGSKERRQERCKESTKARIKEA